MTTKYHVSLLSRQEAVLPDVTQSKAIATNINVKRRDNMFRSNINYPEIVEHLRRIETRQEIEKHDCTIQQLFN